MAYVAVSGGEESIAASLELLRRRDASAAARLSLQLIVQALPELVDQVMGEASLYDPTLAALALKQGAGSTEEAVFLLRAFRSTLERPYLSRVIESSQMRVERRISAAFKDILGGQILGLTRDYNHRLLDFSLLDAEKTGAFASAAKASGGGEEACEALTVDAFCGFTGFAHLPKVSTYLAQQGLYTLPQPSDEEPCDITMEPLNFPAPRSARLQILARGMTQAVMALGYAAIRGFGPAHPTVGELRQGRLPLYIDHPLAPGAEEDAYYVGALLVTEVESLFSRERAQQAQRQTEKPETEPDAMRQSAADATEAAPPKPAAGAAGAAGAAAVVTPAKAVADATNEAQSPKPVPAKHELEFEIGYGLVYGRAESKAIAISVLDHCLAMGDRRYPTQDEEFVLYHVDGIEATGFLSHLKLPHYVTFQSKLDSVRATQKQPSEAAASAPVTPETTKRSGEESLREGCQPTNREATAGAREGVCDAPTL
jgi:alpha-D-ribose 1-methylphosphonate 5-triphosphate synthase subunit PhnI